MRLHLAGNMTKDCIDSFEEYKKKYPHKSLFILQSFIDFHKKIDNLNYFASYGEDFILDSGAFSMLYGKAKKVDINEYAEKYIEAINRFDIKNFMELDLYNIIGIPETEKLRNKIEQGTGKQVIPVFHKELGMAYFEKLIKEYSYIAIGGIAMTGNGGYTTAILRKLVLMAKAENCKVHGLGFTKIDKLADIPFWSVDSTSWLAPVRFGFGLHQFKDGKLSVIEKPKGTRMKTEPIRLHQLQVWLQIMQWVKVNYNTKM